MIVLARMYGKQSGATDERKRLARSSRSIISNPSFIRHLAVVRFSVREAREMPRGPRLPGIHWRGLVQFSRRARCSAVLALR